MTTNKFNRKDDEALLNSYAEALESAKYNALTSLNGYKGLDLILLVDESHKGFDPCNEETTSFEDLRLTEKTINDTVNKLYEHMVVNLP